MKQEIERRKPQNFLDYFALSVTTFGVGYLPLAPGTYGSAVGVIIYLAIEWLNLYIAIAVLGFSHRTPEIESWTHVIVTVFFLVFCLSGIWAASRAVELLGNTDPPQVVVDEVIGQLTVFLFVPFGISWTIILAGFLLFRLFDIWKPYPIDSLQDLPAGIGVCADDILAGVYAGICLAVIYAVNISI